MFVHEITEFIFFDLLFFAIAMIAYSKTQTGMCRLGPHATHIQNMLQIWARMVGPSVATPACCPINIPTCGRDLVHTSHIGRALLSGNTSNRMQRRNTNSIRGSRILVGPWAATPTACHEVAYWSGLGPQHQQHAQENARLKWPNNHQSSSELHPNQLWKMYCRSILLISPWI